MTMAGCFSVRALSRLFVPLLVIVFLTACELEPIPNAAMAGGSTAFVMVLEPSAACMDGDTDTVCDVTEVGFTTPLTQAWGIESLQRGSLNVELDGCNGGTCPLTVRNVFRTAPDPSSFVGLGIKPVGLDPEPSLQISQTYGLTVIRYPTVILCDIPATTPAGSYNVSISVDRPLANGGTETVALPYAQTLTVLPNIVNDVTASPASFGFSESYAALHNYPNPKLFLKMTPLANPAITAGEFVVQFPADKIHILGVIEDDSYGRQSIIDWSVGAIGSADDGMLFVKFMQPLNGTDGIKTIQRLALVFQSLDTLPIPAPAAVSEFSINSTELYDIDGNEIVNGAVVVSEIIL